MRNTLPSTRLCNSDDKSLSGWERAILEAKRQIKGLKVSIRIFQDMRDKGAPFPETTFGSAERGSGSNETSEAKPRSPALLERSVSSATSALGEGLLHQRISTLDLISLAKSYVDRVLTHLLRLLFHERNKGEKGGQQAMAYDARSVANELLRIAKSRGLTLTNMQVQKLVYIAHGYSLAILQKPLFRQSVEAWRWGPVIPDLYHALRKYGAGIVSEPIPIINMDSMTETHRKLLETVLDAYGRFTGPQLSTMTHKEDSPWREAYIPNSTFNNNVISNESIKRHYTELLNARAQIAPAAN